ncbi:MAG: EAL domain-containing protein [Solirubrobacterales bacterium]|nr:EAL domain-containing protein [Solirubrobacterales bacterium]
MADDPHDAATVRSTVELGHRLGLRVIAEGVETLAASERLPDCACDRGAGRLRGPSDVLGQAPGMAARDRPTNADRHARPALAGRPSVATWVRNPGAG